MKTFVAAAAFSVEGLKALMAAVPESVFATARPCAGYVVRDQGVELTFDQRSAIAGRAIELPILGCDRFEERLELACVRLAEAIVTEVDYIIAEVMAHLRCEVVKAKTAGGAPAPGMEETLHQALQAASRLEAEVGRLRRAEWALSYELFTASPTQHRPH